MHSSSVDRAGEKAGDEAATAREFNLPHAHTDLLVDCGRVTDTSVSRFL